MLEQAGTHIVDMGGRVDVNAVNERIKQETAGQEMRPRQPQERPSLAEAPAVRASVRAPGHQTPLALPAQRRPDLGGVPSPVLGHVPEAGFKVGLVAARVAASLVQVGVVQAGQHV